jgi:hypothetical protein
VIDGPVGEEAARRKAGMTSPDDDRGNALDWTAPCQATSTVTLTGLVMTS